MVTLLIYRHLGFFFAKLVVVWIMAIILLFGCSSKKKVAKEEQVQEIDLLSLITIQTPDWKEDKSMLLDEDNMDKYLDDEADLYLSYRLKRKEVKTMALEKNSEKVSPEILMLGFLCIKDIEGLTRRVSILDRFGLKDADIATICDVALQSVRTARQKAKKLNETKVSKTSSEGRAR